MKMIVASLLVLMAAGSALAVPPARPPAAKPDEKRQLLAEQDTVAKFTGIAYQRCRGMTAQCPDNCGQSGDFATFTIISYLAYRKPGQYGDPKTTTYTFQVEDNHRNLKVPKELAAEVRGLKPGDHVLLDWRHDYVTRFEAGGGSASFPERPITKLHKISKDEADRLMKQKPVGTPASQPAVKPGPASQPAADAFETTRKKAEDRVNVAVEGGKAVFSITSSSGIGSATIRRKTANWANEVVVRLHLRGLESLVVGGEQRVSVSVNSSDGKARLHLLTGNKQGPQLDKDSPFWMGVRVLDASGKAVTGLPPKDGFFEVGVPKALLGEKDTLSLEWIDFYRG